MINVDANVAARFWGYVQKLDADSCWNWTGGTSKSGNSITGKWMPPRQSTLSCQVHRAAWQLTYGEIPEGKRIRHTCTTLLCCNPYHLKVADDLEERFWSKVDKTTPGQGRGDCWLWTGRVNSGGYGQFRSDPKKSHQMAHRVAYELIKGQIPEGLFILHECDIRRCCRPGHLSTGTTNDNIQDMIAKGRSNFIPPVALKGAAHPSASVTEEQVRDIKKMFADGATYREVIDKHKVSKGTAYNIKVGKHWSYVE